MEGSLLPITLIASIVAVITTLILGAFVFLNDKKSIINRWFLVITIAISFWILAVILRFYNVDDFFLTLSTRFVFAAASMITLSFFYFSYYFPRRNKYTISFLWHALLMFTTGALVLSNLFFPSLFIREFKNVGDVLQNVYGIGYYFFVVYFVVVFGAGFVNLYKKWRDLNVTERRQFTYFVAGIILSTVFVSVTNIAIPVLTGLSQFSRFGPVAILGFVIFATYAITKHGLFKIKLVATELLVILLGVVLLVDTLAADSLSELLFKLLTLSIFLYLGVGLIRSVFREIEQREQLTRAYDDLKKLDEAKTEFISIASHQLRTPLTAIKGYLSMMLEGTYGELGKKLQGPLESVYESNTRLINLVNELLNISRIQSGKIQMEYQKVQLEGLIREVIRELGAKAEARGLKLIFEEPDAKLPSITADREKLRNVILNVVDNAIRYTEKGSATLSAREKGDSIKIQIRDTGEGMDEKELEGLFRSFSRGRAGQKYWTEGAGLGLYIAKQFVQMHGGEIWAESAGKGKGSTFTILLPRETELP